MKPNLLLSMSTLFFSVVFAGNSFAQEEISIAKLPGVAMATNSSNLNTEHTALNANVERVFTQYFKDARDLKWTKVNDNYFASFSMNDQQHSALFRKNGYMINHVIHGYEQALPAGIRRMIKTNPDYFDYKITNVTNIKQDKLDVWAAYLESNKDIVLVRSENGSLEEVERIQKP